MFIGHILGAFRGLDDYGIVVDRRKSTYTSAGKSQVGIDTRQELIRAEWRARAKS